MNQRNPPPHGGHYEPTLEQREYRERRDRESSEWRAKRERIAELEAELRQARAALEVK